jgi:hypothetical protein
MTPFLSVRNGATAANQASVVDYIGLMTTRTA